MTTVTLDEITRNAILAALDERSARLEKVVADAQAAKDWLDANDKPVTEDHQRMLVWSIAALHETNMARLTVGEAEPWSESEMRVAAGNR